MKRSFTLATTWLQKEQHWSTDPCDVITHPDKALCGEPAYSQRVIDLLADRHERTAERIANLPGCRWCVLVAGVRPEATP